MAWMSVTYLWLHKLSCWKWGEYHHRNVWVHFSQMTNNGHAFILKTKNVLILSTPAQFRIHMINTSYAWWRHQMETFSALLALCITTGHRWIPRTKASDAELWCFLWSAWINGWVNNREAGDLKRHRAHFDVIVMVWNSRTVYNKWMKRTWIYLTIYYLAWT